jgi:hypothetical protein
MTPRRTAPARGVPSPDETLVDEALGLRPGVPLSGKFPFERSTFVKAMVAFGPLRKAVSESW